MTEKQCRMIDFLKEYAEVFETVLVDEKAKLKSFTAFDITQINAAISKQQANQLRISNIEAKRIDLQKELGYDGMTLKQIIEGFEDKKEINELYNRINVAVNEVKFYNEKAMEIAKSQIALFETSMKDSSTYTKTKQKLDNQEQLIKERF